MIGPRPWLLLIIFWVRPRPHGADGTGIVQYRRMAIRLKLRSTRLHSLRHYSATELLAAGVDLRTVAGRLGPDQVGAIGT
jgi:integrase